MKCPRRWRSTCHKKALGARAKKVPTRGMPDFLLRVVALQFFAPSLGRKHAVSSVKPQAVWGWKPRPVATTLIHCAQSLIATGAV